MITSFFVLFGLTICRNKAQKITVWEKTLRGQDLSYTGGPFPEALRQRSIMIMSMTNSTSTKTTTFTITALLETNTVDGNRHISTNTTNCFVNTSNANNSELPWAFQTADVVVRLIEGLLAVLANSLTILAIAKYEFLRTNTNLLIACLAAGDLIGGLSPGFLLVHYRLHLHDAAWTMLCAAEQFLNMLSAGVNIQTITWVSLDRFLFINFPLRYPSLVRRSVVLGAIAVTWTWSVSIVVVLTALGVSCEPKAVCRAENIYTHRQLFRWVSTVQVSVCSLATLLLYSRIAYVAYKHAYQINQEMNTVTGVSVGSPKREYKITKMMVLVLGVYFASYIPQLTSLVAVRRYKDVPDWLSMIERCGAWMWWINSWMNPFIYAWKSREFNRGFRLLLGFKTSQVSPS